MSFRQRKSHQDADHRIWRQWLEWHRPALEIVGLPPGVTLSENHWIDFLQNGYLERHPDAHDGFVFDQLSAEQMKVLLSVLESLPVYAAEPMVGWLRHRLGRATAG